MAVQEAVVSAPSARVVGNAFVEQYYHILHQSPNLVYRFYQDSSLLSRPDNSGNITTVTTTQGINDMIVSLKYEDVIAEIKTADAQESYGRGVIVLVTGCLTGKDAVKRNFSQTFFLAPQEKGYFVLNDVFRYVEESAPPTSASINTEIDNITTAATSAVVELTPELEPVSAPEQNPTDQNPEEPETSFEELNNGPEVCDPSDDEGSIIEEEAVEFVVVDAAPAAYDDDTPKKSYASILKVVQGNVVTRKIHVASNALKVAPPKEQPQPSPVKPSTPATSGPTSNDGVFDNSNVHEGEGYSIYVRNLPFDATVEQLEEVFRNFGTIKTHGIQVRSNKGACFGFVEFDSLKAMQSAIEASPVAIGNRPAVVEEKRTTTRVGGRGRFPPGRGHFRNESFRGAPGIFSGRGYGRSTEYRTQGEFSPRPRVPMGPTNSMGRGGEGYRPYQNGRGGEGYRPYQNGRGRGGRVGPGRGGPVPA